MCSGGHGDPNGSGDLDGAQDDTCLQATVDEDEYKQLEGWADGRQDMCDSYFM